VRQTSGHPILANGIIYGVLILVVSLATNALSLAGVRLTNTVTALAISGAIFLIEIVIEIVLFLLAGRGASARTGTVGAGALAGVLAAAIAGVVGAVITIIQVIIDPAAIRDAVIPANPQVSASLLTDQVIIATAIVSAILGLLFLLGVGAGAGALGGLLGRGRYQPATYQESIYQGLPPVG
jgi:hypothetical protein